MNKKLCKLSTVEINNYINRCHEIITKAAWRDFDAEIENAAKTGGDIVALQLEHAELENRARIARIEANNLQNNILPIALSREIRGAVGRAEVTRAQQKPAAIAARNRLVDATNELACAMAAWDKIQKDSIDACQEVKEIAHRAGMLNTEMLKVWGSDKINQIPKKLMQVVHKIEGAKHRNYMIDNLD